MQSKNSDEKFAKQNNEEKIETTFCSENRSNSVHKMLPGTLRLMHSECLASSVELCFTHPALSTSVVDPDPNWIRIQELCGSGSSFRIPVRIQVKIG